MTTVAEHPGVEDVEPSFADAARAFLDAHASRKDPEVTFVWGEGNDGVSIFEERDRRILAAGVGVEEGACGVGEGGVDLLHARVLGDGRHAATVRDAPRRAATGADPGGRRTAV